MVRATLASCLFLCFILQARSQDDPGEKAAVEKLRTARRNVAALYEQILGRKADEGEIGPHAGRVLSGVPLHELVITLVVSDEYRDRHLKNKSPREMVKVLFKTILGRDPESEQVIDNHARPIAARGWQAVARDIANSSESRNRYRDYQQLGKSGEKSLPSADKKPNVPPNEKAAATEKAIKISNPYNVYLDDGDLAGDLKLKGKLIELTDHVYKIGSKQGKYFVSFISASGTEFFADVIFYIKPDKVASFSKVQQHGAFFGDKITVRAKCLGKRPLLGSWMGWGVFFDEAELVAHYPRNKPPSANEPKPNVKK